MCKTDKKTRNYNICFFFTTWENVPWKLRKLKCKNKLIIIGFKGQNKTK